MLGKSIDRRNFVGRKDEIENFHAFIQHQTKKPIWFIWGIGGIGKSSLLKQFEQESKSSGVVPIKVNLEENISYQKILNDACDKLGREHFINFAYLVERHWEESRTVKIDSTQSPESSSIDFGQNNVFQDIHIENMAGGNITNIGQIITNVEQERKLFFRKRETEAFITEFQQAATHQPIVWLFDTYEKIGPDLENWLWENLLENLYHGKMPHVNAVLTGREHVDAKKRQYVKSDELGYFTEHDVRTYLQRSGFAQIDTEFIKALFNFTKGHPLCVSIAIDLIENMVSSGEELSAEMFSGYEQREFEKELVAEFLIKGILKRVSDVSRRNIIERCAVTRWFNRETLRLICGEDERIRESIDTLRQYSFVRSHQYGLTYHEIIQHLLYHNLRREDKMEFRKFNEKALHYFMEKSKAAESDKERQDYLVEQVYHQVAINQGDGIPFFQKFFHVGNVLYDVAWCSALLKAVKPHPLSDENAIIVLFYELLLASMTNQWEDIIRLGKKFLSNPIQDKIHHAQALELIATAYRHKLGKDNLEEAIKFYNQSLDIRQREVDIDKAAIRDTLRERAECSRLQGDVIQTEEGLKESLEIALQLHTRSPKDQHALGMCYLYLGNLARVQGKWQVAFENYAKAVDNLRELDPYEYNRTLYGFGYVSFYQGRWNEAIRYHKEAHQAFLKSKENYAIAATGHALGHDYVFLGEYKNALDVLQKSLDIFTENQWKGNAGRVLGDLGNACYRQGQIEQAAAYFNQALDDIGRDSQHPHLIPILRYFGDLLCDQQQWEEAEHFYQQALFIAKKTESPFDDVQMSIRLCRLFYLSGRSEEISEYTEQIRLLAQQDEYFGQLAHLKCIEGHVLLNQENIDEAFQAYVESCAYAIRYNHYLLDEIFSQIVDGINAKNATSVVLFHDYLSGYWNEHKMENIESESRLRETGDGTPVFIKRLRKLQGRVEMDK